MLSRSLTKRARLSLVKTQLIAQFHHSPLQLKKTAELKQTDDSPFEKISQGINLLKSTVLNAPPLYKITKPNIESLPFTGQATTWDIAVKEAQSLVNSADQERMFDPVKLMGKDLWELKGNITKLLGSGHPFIHTIGKHYMQGDTHRLRPLLVLLMAKATSSAPKDLSPPTSGDHDEFTSPELPILPTQRRLAEISEMIYTASLLHYDVMDHSDQEVNPGFGNKMAVLAGDFLLARSSLALAQLRKAECIELIATCIANLVESEFMNLQDPTEPNPGPHKAFVYYLEKAYNKTGSLIAQSCKASAVLGGCTVEVSQIAYDFGRHMGLALQLLEDVDQFSKVSASKSAKNNELISAPLLLAWQEVPELGSLIERNFSEEGDKKKAHMLVYQSSGLKKTLELASKHIELAISSLESLPTSDAQLALIQLTKNLPTKKE